jgi:hypothetical protein
MVKTNLKAVAFELPRRKFCKGEKKMVSFRLPELLLSEINKISEEFGWSNTEVVITSLDQFVQWAKSKRN